MKLSDVQSSKMELDNKIKEAFSAHKSVETCVRFYDDVVSPDFCTDIINLFEKSKDIDSYNTGNKEYNELDIDILTEMKKKEWEPYRNKFIYVMRTNMERFMNEVGIKDSHFPPVIDMENIRVKKYLPNDKDEFKEHVDVVRAKGPSSKRFLVFILYLSDVEKGGETYIPRYNIKVSPKRGRLLIFPPFWTHPHAGLKPIKGTKYTIMSYLHYGDTQ
tara:strand:+ start:482 stop:1132 length:651 start_codon:yes stop_codon:yes gene_type:complete